MDFYNRNLEKLELNVSDMKNLGFGACGVVLHNDVMILKVYRHITANDFRISEKMFDVLKGINNPHFIEFYDIYTHLSRLGLLKNKIKRATFKVDAYTAKYYSDDSVDVLFESKDYILDNFRELEELFKIFTECMICAYDVRRDNAILGKDGIVIIDPDLFEFWEYPEDFMPISELNIRNKKSLLKLFKSIFIENIQIESNYKEFMNFIENELFSISVTDNSSIVDDFSKKFKYVKRPIDFFDRKNLK